MRTARKPSITRAFWVLALAALPALAAAGAAPKDDAFALFEASLPELRASHPDLYDTPEKLQVAWQQFWQNLALAETARKKGYAERPEMRTRLAQMLGQELILKEAETARSMHAISDAELRAYFEANRDKYDLPAMLGAHEIVLTYVPADAGQRQKQQAKAQDIVQSLGTQPVQLSVFQQLIKTHSDPQSFRTNGGSLGLFPARLHRGQRPPLPESEVQALLELKQVGRVTGALDDGRTLRILRLSAYRAAVPPKLETFKESIRREIYLKAREQRIEELARESGWNPAATLSEQQAQRLLRPPLSSGPPKDLPPMPGGLDIPTPPPPSK